MRVPCYFSGLIFNAYPLYTCQDLHETKIKRRFVERFFSRPWHPGQKYNTLYQQGVVLKWIDGEHVLIAHPLTAAQLLKEAVG